MHFKNNRNVYLINSHIISACKKPLPKMQQSTVLISVLLMMHCTGKGTAECGLVSLLTATTSF